MRFFLIDRVDEIRPGEFARGVKNVTMSEDFMQDHFPDHPVFPGTLIVEAMAQLAGFLVEMTFNTDDKNVRRAVLGQIDKAKFHQPCLPGDQLEVTCRLISTLEGAARVEAEAQVAGSRVARAELTVVLRRVESEKVHQQRRELYRIWTKNLNQEITIR